MIDAKVFFLFLNLFSIFYLRSVGFLFVWNVIELKSST